MYYSPNKYKRYFFNVINFTIHNLHFGIKNEISNVFQVWNLKLNTFWKYDFIFNCKDFDCLTKNYYHIQIILLLFMEVANFSNARFFFFFCCSGNCNGNNLFMIKATRILIDYQWFPIKSCKAIFQILSLSLQKKTFNIHVCI